MYLLLEKVNFHCHVSLLEDTFFLGTRQLPARWESVSFSSSVRRNHWCHWLLTRWLSGGKKHPNYALFLPRETSWAASRISRRRARIDHAPDITGAKKGRKHRGCEAEKDSSVGCKNKKTFTFNPISMWRGFQGSMKKMLESISSVQYVAWLDMPFAGMFFVVWGVDHVTITAASELKKTWFRHRLGEPLTLWQWKVKVSICPFIKLNRFFILDQSQKTNGQRRQFHPQSWRGRKFRDQAGGHRISKEDGTNYHVLVLKNYVPTILFHKIVFLDSAFSEVRVYHLYKDHSGGTNRTMTRRQDPFYTVIWQVRKVSQCTPGVGRKRCGGVNGDGSSKTQVALGTFLTHTIHV